MAIKRARAGGLGPVSRGALRAAHASVVRGARSRPVGACDGSPGDSHEPSSSGTPSQTAHPPQRGAMMVGCVRGRREGSKAATTGQASWGAWSSALGCELLNNAPRTDARRVWTQSNVWRPQAQPTKKQAGAQSKWAHRTASERTRACPGGAPVIPPASERLEPVFQPSPPPTPPAGGTTTPGWLSVRTRLCPHLRRSTPRDRRIMESTGAHVCQDICRLHHQ